MPFIPRDYNDPLCVYSLRLLVSGYGGPIARVIRESDLIEGDVYPDSNNQISYDSTIIVNPEETSALTLGQFLNISGYGNPDNLPDVYEARINKLYDQSAAVNHVVSPNFATSLAFVEHTLPAVFPNSTSIHTINGIPSFLPLSTIPALTINNVRGREMSFHFVSENTSATTYFGFINLTPYYTVSGAWNESNSSVTTGVTPFSSEAWLMSDNYYNGVLGDVAGEFTRTRIGIPTDDSLVCTIQAQLLDTSYTQSDFPDNRMDLSIYSNQWYADIIAYDGYDNIRRLTIEDLLSSGNVNVETKAFTSTLAFTDDGTVDNSFIAQFGTPAAAYSVRDLRGGVDDQGDRVTKIMRVRREIDHAEADVYPDSTGWLSLNSRVEIVPAITGNLEGGTGDEIDSQAVTLGEFVNDPDYDNPDNLVSATTAKVVVWYDQSDPDYLVDNLPESIQERGAPIRIRVIGGTYNNYEFDVYFDNNETISLSSYVADTYEITDSNGQVTAAISNGTLQTLLDAGMTEAAVCVWYDQSGSGNDASQDVSSSQPKIVSERTNLLLQSNQFGTSPWGNSNTTNTAGQIGYDGTSDAWLATVSGGAQIIGQNVSASGIQTVSLYAKGSVNNGLRIFAFGDDNVDFWFNLNTGDVDGSVSSKVLAYNIENAGSGWYRCSFTFTQNLTSIYFYITDNNRSNASSGSIYIQDAQLETGSSATGYIKTTTSAASVSEVVTENGKPAVQFDGSDDALLANHADLYGQSRLDIFTHYFSNDNIYRLYAAEATGGYYSFVSQDGSTSTAVEGFGNQPDLYVNGAQVSITYGTTTRDDIHTAVTTNGSSNSAGSLETIMNGDTVPWVGFGISSYTASSPFAGEIAEIVIYNTPQDGNRTGIESNINDYYDIYGSGNTGVNIKLLDDGFYPDAAAAYSLRKLRTAYGGPVNLSGRKDAKQQVATSQPTIYNNGLVIKNGRAAVQFDGIDDHMDMNYTDLYGQSRLDSFTHYQSDDNLQILYHDDTANGGNYSFISFDGSATTTLYSGYGSPDLYINGSQVTINYGTTTRDDLHTAIVTNGVSAISGALETHLNASTTEWNAFGVSVYNGIRLNGKIAEMIFYNTPQDDNRIDIENNINSAFQIYAANFSSVLDTVPLAKAAYSIRRLTKEYINPIITVSNGSTTKDFYADFWGNLNADALTDFANGGTLSVTKWWDQSGNNYHLLGEYTNKPTLTISNGDVSVNTTNKFTLPLLDRYSGAAAAYSLRELSSSYTGPLVRVRRDGTNTEVDVYPDANGQLSLDSTVSDVAESTTGVTVSESDTLATKLGEFVADAGYTNVDGLAGTVNAFVAVWYDQSNSNDASQIVSASQPKIYAAGTNLLLQSNTFDTTWTNELVGTITGGQSGYDGSSDAWLLEKGAYQYRRIQQTVSVSGVWTLSVYAKEGTTSLFNLRDMDNADRVQFDLSGSGSVVSEFGNISATIQSVGNGWFRCTATFESVATSVGIYVGWSDSTASSIYIQDAQLVPSDTVTDYVETTTSAISQGALITENGKPAVDFDGTNHFLTSASLTTTQPTSMSVVGVYDSGNGFFLDGNSPGNRQAVYISSSQYAIYAGTALSSGVSVSAGPHTHIYALFNGAASEVYVNKTGVSSGNAGTVVLNGIDIGQRYANDFRLDGQIQEIVIWNSNQTSAGNRSGIEENINTYYSIYTGSVPEQQTVAVYSDAINETFDLNTTYTDLKEIIIYE